MSSVVGTRMSSLQPVSRSAATRFPDHSCIREPAEHGHRTRGVLTEVRRGSRTRIRRAVPCRRRRVRTTSWSRARAAPRGRRRARPPRRGGNVASTPAGSGARSQPASPSAHSALRASESGPIDAVSSGGPPACTGAGPTGGRPPTIVSPRHTCCIVATCSSSRAKRRCEGHARAPRSQIPDRRRPHRRSAGRPRARRWWPSASRTAPGREWAAPRRST